MSIEQSTTQLPSDFEPTIEEKSLLALYAKVRLYEKERDRIKEEAAKAKLRAKDEKFRQENESNNKRSLDNDHDIQDTKRSRKGSINDDNNDIMNNEDSDNYDSDNDNESFDDENDGDVVQQQKARKRKEKIQKLREDISKEKGRESLKNEALEEEERKRHLEDDGNDILEIGGLRKIRKQFVNSESLLASVEHQSTPPHEFSKSLAMPKASLNGRQIFPSSTIPYEPGTNSWSPPSAPEGPNDRDLCIELPEFDLSQISGPSSNNTVAIKFVAPQDSSRFSINITEPEHNQYADILFHFNPRQRQKGGQLVINDKQDGIWGQGVNVPLSMLPLIFGQVACTLIIQINTEGFDVFLDKKHCARLEHRKPLPKHKCALKIQMPSTDDYGSPENWEVFKVWWGHKKPMAGDLTDVPGVNVSSYLHPKKLFVSSLTKIYTEAEVDLRRAELERAFRKYGGSQGCDVKVPTNSTFAFVEVETDRMADLALREMQSIYTVARARRTRAEVLQHQREAAGKTAPESNEWD